MAHFSFYPYLLYPPYTESQICQNLQSLFYLHYPHLYSDVPSTIPSFATHLPLLRTSYENWIQKSHNEQVLIKNQEISGIASPRTNNKILCETHQLKKQETHEREHVSSRSKEQSQGVVSKSQKRKAPKKVKNKKLSKKQKKERQTKRNSSENSKRNIIPNQIHQILSIILKRNKSAHLVEKLLLEFSAKSSQIVLSVQRFYLYQSILKEKINHYANEESLKYLMRHLEPECVIYSRQEQEIYSRVGLRLISYFLRDQAALIIMNSQRIKSCNKLDHLKTKRYLQNFINQMMQERFHQKVSGGKTHQQCSQQ